MKVSPGNTKLGKIPNVSLVPAKDCPKICQKYCAKKCYALKAYRQYAGVRKAWGENSLEIKRDMKRWFKDLDAYLAKKKPRFFRFHVAGDILSTLHFNAICGTAQAFPKTKFLVFTKNYKAIRGHVPDNLQVVLSVWEGMKQRDIPARLWYFPKAYAGDCSSFDGFDDAIECPGKCDACGMCWELGKLFRDVKFSLH